VSRSGFYGYLAEPETERERFDAGLAAKTRAVFAAHEGRCGSPRVCRELRERGDLVSAKRGARLMRENGLVARGFEGAVSHAFARAALRYACDVTLARDTSDEVQARMDAAYRRMSEREKLERAVGLSATLRELTLDHLRELHPRDSTRQLKIRLLLRTIPASVVEKAFGWLPEGAVSDGG
jgi:hypothetical protein